MTNFGEFFITKNDNRGFLKKKSDKKRWQKSSAAITLGAYFMKKFFFCKNYILGGDFETLFLLKKRSKSCFFCIENCQTFEMIQTFGMYFDAENLACESYTKARVKVLSRSLNSITKLHFIESSNKGQDMT